MAVGRSLIVPFTGLLALLLLLPAVAAAECRPSGGDGPGTALAEAARAADGSGQLAAASQHPVTMALAAPEVSRAPTRPDAAQPQALRVRGSGGGAPRGDGPGPAGPGGRHRRGPPAADPVPFAPPARSAHEQNGPEPGARGRKDAMHPPAPVTGEAEVPDPVLLLRFLVVLGFRRVRPGNVLEHPLRRTLHAAVSADPGLDLAGCVAATGANRETLRYHLALLVCCGKVAEETRSGSVRYFPYDPALTPVRRAVLHAVRNASLAPMLAAIRDAPGISRRELADRLGVAGPSVTRQVRRLVDEGLVQAERCGRSTCYRPTAACLSALGPADAASGNGRPVPHRAAA